MSVFVVEDKTINVIVNFLALSRDHEFYKRQLLEEGINLTTIEGKIKLGQAMFDLNCDAVNYRYDDKPADKFHPLPYVYSLISNYPTISVIKALDCFLYQCSEGDIDKRPLFGILEDFKNSLCHSIIQNRPEYQAAFWG